MSQQEGDCDQAWEAADGRPGNTADEHVEVIGDVKVFEQQLQQPTGPREAVGAFGEVPKVIETAMSSPFMDLVAYECPCR